MYRKPDLKNMTFGLMFTMQINPISSIICTIADKALLKLQITSVQRLALSGLVHRHVHVVNHARQATRVSVIDAMLAALQ